MRALIFVVLVCVSVCCFASPVQQEYGVGQRKYKTSDKQLLERQKNILRLYKFIYQRCRCKDQVEIATTFSIEDRSSDFTNSQAVKDFLVAYRHGLLPRGAIFSVFNEHQLKQAISLFRLFYYAKDFDTFYKAAVWARFNINEGIFVYALSVALVHRQDTYGIVLPPIYEIFPNYFFNSDVIQKIQDYKQALKQTSDVQKYLVISNYSGHYLNLNPEQSMSYYLEDVGVNAFYYYSSIYYPFWLGGDEFKLKNDRRGEQYYYLYQQLLARYYLERLSNDYGEIEYLDWDQPVKTGYYPSLRYANGLEFPARPNFARLSEWYYNYGQSWTWKDKYGFSNILVKDFERRIRDAIDFGYVASIKDGKKIDLYTPEGFDLLGTIVESNADSPNRRYYGSLERYARHLLGYAPQPLDKYKLAPAALEHFETACRDPAFYQLYKRLVLIFQKYKTNLPPYSYNELLNPGLKVDKIEFDRLITYMDNFDADATNALYVTPEEYENENVRIKVRQQRLNHKPFSYRITVNSEKAQDAVVRIYLGPKHDEFGRMININENRINFVEVDIFRYPIKAGKNVIERNSREFYWYIPDRTSYRDIYKKVLGALENDGELQLDASEAFYGFPNRLLLPRGKPYGQVYQIYVIVNSYQAPSGQQKRQEGDYYYHRVGSGNSFIDNYAFGFPLDRVIDEYNFYVPNSAFQDVVIYHKSIEDINSSQSQSE